jgi:hypothetical protein
MKTTHYEVGLCALLFGIFSAVAAGSPPAEASSFRGRLVTIEDCSEPVIGKDHPDVMASSNRTGFETGEVVLQDGIYYMFVGEMFDQAHQDMRAALWKSKNGTDWTRVCTLKNSLLHDQSPVNMKKEVWITGAEFNETENRWNIFYIAYTGGIRQYQEPERTRTRDYYGRVFRAVSIYPGREGIEGPYEDVDIIMYPEWAEPKNLEGQQHLSIKIVDENPGTVWEGQQAIASFSPYQIADGSWMSFIGGHWHEPRQKKWIVGMAHSEHLSGPWERSHELSPSPLTDSFSENPIVTRLADGRYIAVFDCHMEKGDPQDVTTDANAIGYSISEDGKHWPRRKVLNVLPNQDWASLMRTPMGLLPEGDNVFRVYYTCKQKEPNGEGDFYPIGMARVKLVN